MSLLALRLALNHLKQKPLARLFVIMAVGSVLTINGLLFVLLEYFSKSLNEIQSSRYATAYLSGSVAPAEEPRIVSAIKKIPGISSAQLVSKDVFLASFSKYFPQLGSELADLEPEAIPRYVKVRMHEGSADDVESRLSKVSGVDSVELNHARYDGLARILGSLRKLVAVLTVGMTVALLCILLNHFKLGSVFQLQVSQTLTLLGARGHQLLLPFALEGAIEGGLGGILAGSLLLAMARIFHSQVGEVFGAFGFRPSSFSFLPLAVSMVGVGVLSGVIGSVWAAVRKLA